MASNTKREAAPAQQPPERISEHGTPLISDDKLRQLYSAMLQCRALEERARALARRKNLLHFSSAGQQEAILAAVSMDLRPDDTIAPSEGSFIADFVKGASLHTTLHAMQCLIAAGSTGKGRSSPGPASPSSASLDDGAANALIPPASTAAQISIATGLGLAKKLRHTGHIVVVFARGRWASAGVEEEALRFAGMHGLPILYVVQDGTGADSRSATGDDYGFPSIPVDGNDLVALYRVAHEAIKRARQGGGPTLMDCKLRHCSDQLDHDRSETDPVARMERYLATRKLFSQDWKRQIVRAFKVELDAAVKQARRA
ncbi:MAG: thiamine pyrophosphate-dependent enzyme [Acidobacteriaceae bacterium]